MKTERQIIVEILNSYADEIEGMDFNHIPDYKFNSVANDIINYIEAKPSNEVIKGIALFNELKGIAKVELALSDNCYMLVTEYLHSKFMEYPVSLSKAGAAAMLLEFLGVIDKKIKFLQLTK